jgi:hypothetical protein
MFFPKKLRHTAEIRKPGITSICPESPAAPFLLHTPVKALHSIEFKAHTKSLFSLTQKIEGVKHNCSLTVSEVFPVGAASGGQARSPDADCRSANVREVGQPINLTYRVQAA